MRPPALQSKESQREKGACLRVGPTDRCSCAALMCHVACRSVPWSDFVNLHVLPPHRSDTVYTYASTSTTPPSTMNFSKVILVLAMIAGADAFVVRAAPLVREHGLPWIHCSATGPPPPRTRPVPLRPPARPRPYLRSAAGESALAPGAYVPSWAASHGGCGGGCSLPGRAAIGRWHRGAAVCRAHAPSCPFPSRTRFASI